MPKPKSREKALSEVTVYVVQAFSAVRGKKGQISPDQPLQAQDEPHARRLFQRFVDAGRAGVVAFRRTGTPATGDWADAVIIARYGAVPGDVDALDDESADEADAA